MESNIIMKSKDRELFGIVIIPPLGTVKPLLNVCNAVQVFAVDNDTPEDSPEIEPTSIELGGK
jgi:hypothetical protein